MFKLYGTIKNNKIFVAKELMEMYCSTFKEETKVEIKAVKATRSDIQNNYYWGVVIKIISDELGYTPDEIHEILKYRLLLVYGEYPYVRSTASLSTVEFEEYLNRIRTWAMLQLGCYIPLPNEHDTQINTN